MIKVDLGAEPGMLMKAVRHHAKDVEHIVSELRGSMLFYCGADNTRNWTLIQSRSGPNSFWLTDGKRQFHFRYDHAQPGVITVKNSYYRGKVIATLKSRRDAIRFIEVITGVTNPLTGTTTWNMTMATAP
jgi:hypothetical protein